MRARIAATLVRTVAFGLASFAASGVDLGTGAAPGGPDQSAWMNRIQQARARLSTAQDRYASAMVSYRQMKHRRRARGEQKLSILTQRKAARSELTAAQRELDALLEQARREGVPPGWLREAMATEIPAAQPD